MARIRWHPNRLIPGLDDERIGHQRGESTLACPEGKRSVLPAPTDVSIAIERPNR
jgi:hypothetical protein